MKNKYRQILAWTAFALAMAQTVLVLLSWIFSATIGGLRIHSLIGSEGIRWFFGHFTDNLAQPLLVWIILLMIAVGCISESGFIGAVRRLFTSRQSVTYRERLGIQFSILIILIIAIVVVLLTLIPHAILLSLTGNLFPSSFSASIIPIAAFTMVSVGIMFGLLSGNFSSIVDVVNSLTAGTSSTVPFFLFYILGVELYFMILFVFGL
jgi:p-aminobenzoyl-glutamate transporter AbgT